MYRLLALSVDQFLLRPTTRERPTTRAWRGAPNSDFSDKFLSHATAAHTGADRFPTRRAGLSAQELFRLRRARAALHRRRRRAGRASRNCTRRVADGTAPCIVPHRAGPRASTAATPITYSPAGYDPVYGALVFNASQQRARCDHQRALRHLKKPLIILRSYTANSYPTTVKFGGSTLTIDVDYFPSLRTSPNELWITLNRDVTGANNRLQITP